MQALSSELLRQFGEYRQSDCDLNIVTHIHTWRMRVTSFHMFVRFLFCLRTGCVVDAVIGCWVCVFENGLQTVSVLGHGCKLSVEGCCVSLAGKYTCMPLNCDVHKVTSQYSHSRVENLYGIVSCICVFSVPLAPCTVTLMRSLVGGSVFSGTDCRP